MRCDRGHDKEGALVERRTEFATESGKGGFQILPETVVGKGGNGGTDPTKGFIPTEPAEHTEDDDARGDEQKGGFAPQAPAQDAGVKVLKEAVKRQQAADDEQREHDVEERAAIEAERHPICGQPADGKRGDG